MMERTLCVWFPDWPLRHPWSRSDAPSPDKPRIAIGEDNRVVALNRPADAAGLRAGMRRREAEAICPAVEMMQSDPSAEATAFEPVAAVVESIVPRVEIAHPGLLFVPLAGAVRFYGGETEAARRIAKEVEAAAGDGARIGVAAGPFAARQATDRATDEEPIYIVEDDAAFLASLDISTLGREELAATFRWLGIRTLGELSRLPPQAMVSRFGNDGLEMHRTAIGEDRPVAPREIPGDASVEERFSPPLELLEQAGFAARRLVHRLIEQLEEIGVAAHRVRVEAEAADGALRDRIWRSNDPFSDSALAERVRWQLRAWVEGGGIPGGLVRLRLVPADVSDRGRQLGLGEDVVTKSEAERAFARAQVLVGPEGVLQAGPQGGRDPVERVQWYRWGEPAPVPERDLDVPWPGRIPGPTPALVPPRPRLLEVEWDQGSPAQVRLGSRWEPVLQWAGPWRKTGRWWDGEVPADRYQIVTSAGAFLCEQKEGGTYLIGVYD